MSASQHILRVPRNGGPAPKNRSALPVQVRIALLIGLTCGVLYLVVRTAGPDLLHILAALQDQLALSRHLWH